MGILAAGLCGFHSLLAEFSFESSQEFPQGRVPGARRYSREYTVVVETRLDHKHLKVELDRLASNERIETIERNAEVTAELCFVMIFGNRGGNLRHVDVEIGALGDGSAESAEIGFKQRLQPLGVERNIVRDLHGEDVREVRI